MVLKFFHRRNDKTELTPEQLARKKRRRQIRNIIRLTILTLVIVFLFNPVRSLLTLNKVDNYPLYTMHWHGGYSYLNTIGKAYNWINQPKPKPATKKESPSACTVFAALGDPENVVVGRNFDWTFSPLLLLFTDSPNGYASVTVVDIAYLGFTEENANDPPWYLKLRLWLAPGIPFEGINEHGLTIATAAVANLDPIRNSKKEDILSLGIIRVVLDQAKNVDEAVDIMKRYNIIFPAGPNVHYLLADSKGNSAVVEALKDGSLAVIRNEHPFQVITNHYLATNPDKYCRRMDRCNKVLSAAQGKCSPDQAMDLLEKVQLGCTVWSIVYELNHKKLTICLDRNYKTKHTFSLK